MQCPFYLVHALELVFNLPAEKCRVIQTETGGAFGGKEDFPSVIGSHAALLAMKSGHPVKLCYDRGEDMAATTKRHPSRTRHRTAVSKDGKLLAGEIDFAIDGGAYITLSPVVLSRGTIHAPGPYHWPYLTVRAKAMATNIPPHGAFRGFGAPQSIFALERHMDKIAKVVGLTPEELRRRNLLSTGDRTATGQLLYDPVDMQHLLTRALQESNYHAKRAQFDRENPTSTIRRGIGFATFFHGAGFTGSGERRLNSLVAIELTPEGQPLILVSSTEFGQGTNTILCQVAAQALRLPYDQVLIAQPDTSQVPNSGPTVASRTAMIVGKLVERAAESLSPPSLPSWRPTAKQTDRFPHQNRPVTRLPNSAVQPSAISPNSASQSRSALRIARQYLLGRRNLQRRSLSRLRLGRLRRRGRRRHDHLRRHRHQLPCSPGSRQSPQPHPRRRPDRGRRRPGHRLCALRKVPLAERPPRQQSDDQLHHANQRRPPPIHVSFEETPTPHGPGGAKGIGELPMDGPAPAILNAIEHATGIAFTEIPLLPEDIFERMTRTPDSGTEDLNPAVAGPIFSEVTA